MAQQFSGQAGRLLLCTGRRRVGLEDLGGRLRSGDDDLGLLCVEAGCGEAAFALPFRFRGRWIVLRFGRVDHHGLGFGVVGHQGVAFGAYFAGIGGPLTGRFGRGFTGGAVWLGCVGHIWSLAIQPSVGPIVELVRPARTMDPMTPMGDLLGPEPILLPRDGEAEAKLLANESPGIVAAAHPSAAVAWAALAEAVLASNEASDRAVTAYAYARTGYHRGLDQLRRHGWKGFGPVPYSHEPNRGFLRCVAALARAADAIGESDEYGRCLDLLDDCDPAARPALGL